MDFYCRSKHQVWFLGVCQPTPRAYGPVSAFLAQGLWVSTAVPGFYVGTGSRDLGPHACVANTLLTEPFPQPQVWEFLSTKEDTKAQGNE